MTAGFKVIRDPILGSVEYRDAVFDANYLNWLVGNGFVITVGFGHEEYDVAAKKRIVGFDVMELAPDLGPKAASYAAAKLTYRMIGLALGPTEG